MTISVRYFEFLSLVSEEKFVNVSLHTFSHSHPTLVAMFFDGSVSI